MGYVRLPDGKKIDTASRKEWAVVGFVPYRGTEPVWRIWSTHERRDLAERRLAEWGSLAHKFFVAPILPGAPSGNGRGEPGPAALRARFTIGG